MLLPFQAIECYLPIKAAKDNIWAEAAKNYFKELVNGKILWAKITHKKLDQSFVIDLFHK